MAYCRSPAPTSPGCSGPRASCWRARKNIDIANAEVAGKLVRGTDQSLGERQALENLNRQGFGHPPATDQARTPPPRRWQGTVEPLFPGYLFVQLDLGRQNTAPIRSTRGVIGMVRFMAPNRNRFRTHARAAGSAGRREAVRSTRQPVFRQATRSPG